MERKARPAGEKSSVTKTVTSDALAESGKKNPAKLGDSGVVEEDETEMSAVKISKSKNLYVPVAKVNYDEQTVTGIVLQPEVVDAQGDIMDADVIRKAAHNFLAKYNNVTTLGLQHKYFGVYDFELYESWITPQDVVINSTLVKSGSWVMTVKINDNKVWEKVKTGKLTGFSIGGIAKVQKLTDEG